MTYAADAGGSPSGHVPSVGGASPASQPPVPPPAEPTGGVPGPTTNARAGTAGPPRPVGWVGARPRNRETPDPEERARQEHLDVRHVETVPAEARQYQGMRAGVITRTMAAAIDLGVVVGALAGTWVAWFAVLFMLDPTNVATPTYQPWMALALGWFYAMLYLTVAWSTTGRTVGNQLLGLRVVNFRGERLRFVGAVLRASFCTAFSIGLFWCAVSRQNRSVQDVVLRTSVIYDWEVRVAPTSTPPEPAG